MQGEHGADLDGRGRKAGRDRGDPSVDQQFGTIRGVSGGDAEPGTRRSESVACRGERGEQRLAAGVCAGYVPGRGELHAENDADFVDARRCAGKFFETGGSGVERVGKTNRLVGREERDSVYADGAGG